MAQRPELDFSPPRGDHPDHFQVIQQFSPVSAVLFGSHLAERLRACIPIAVGRLVKFFGGTRGGGALSMARPALRPAMLVLGLFAAFATLPIWQGTQLVQAQSSECFTETGFCISNPRFREYFHLRGGVGTFGYPISREFRLQGFNVQFFQGLVLQQPEGGSASILNLLGPELMPAKRINGSTFPTEDPAIVAPTPRVDDPEYAARIVAFTREHVADEFAGRRTGF